MAPTLSDGDILLVRPHADVNPGSIVLVRWPSRPGQLSVKRALRQQDHGWFVVGDNTFGSTDSRELGPADVLGVAMCRLWPSPSLLATREQKWGR